MRKIKVNFPLNFDDIMHIVTITKISVLTLMFFDADSSIVKFIALGTDNKPHD
jgi:hypothetical protein